MSSRNQLKNLSNSAVTEIVMGMLICCWVTVSVILRVHNEWTGAAVAASLGGGIVLAAWLVWSNYILATKRVVKEMPVKPRRAIEVCSWVLLVYCLLVNIFPTLAWGGMVQIAWLALAVCAGYYLNQRLGRQGSETGGAME